MGSLKKGGVRLHEPDWTNLAVDRLSFIIVSGISSPLAS